MALSWILKWSLEVCGGGISRRVEKEAIRHVAKGQVTLASCPISKKRWLVELSPRLSQQARSIDMYGRRIAC